MNKEGNKKIILSKKFYDLASINEAISDYCDVCKIEVKSKNNEFQIEFKYFSKEKNIENEFSNHILAIVKNKMNERKK